MTLASTNWVGRGEGNVEKKKEKTIRKGDTQLEGGERRADMMKNLSYSGVLTQISPH